MTKERRGLRHDVVYEVFCSILPEPPWRYYISDFVYKSLSYRIFSIAIPIVSLVVGCVFSAFSVAVTMLIIEVLFVFSLLVEVCMFMKK